MIVENNLYWKNISLELHPIPNEEYIPLAQLLSWVTSYRMYSSSIPFFKISVTSQDIYDKIQIFSVESELLNKFKEDANNQKYIDYGIFYTNAGMARRPLSTIIYNPQVPKVFTQVRTVSTNKFLSGWGIFGVPTILDQFNCIFCTVVHKDNCLGVLNCILENKEIDNSLLEVWYNSNLRLRGSDYFKGIKAKINSYIKELENQGIKSVGMSKIPFFKMINLPKFSTLEEKRNFVKDIYKKMIAT